MNAPANFVAPPGSYRPPLIASPLMPSLERRRLQCYLALLTADVLALFLAFAVAGYLYLADYGMWQGLLFAQLLLPVFLTFALYNGAYSVLTLRDAFSGFKRALMALVISFAAVQFIAFYAKANESLSRVIVTAGLALTALLIIGVRVLMRGFIRWRCGEHVVNELVIDDGGPHVHRMGTRRISASEMDLSPSLDDPHAIERIGLALRNADRVIVSCPPGRRAVWALILKGANVAGEVMDETVVELGASGASIAGGQGWLTVSSGPLGLRQRAAKRSFDFAISVVALVVLSPLLLAIALAILVEDGRPVFFTQKRLGRGNRFFRIYKFRSMAAGRTDVDGTVSASPDDNRVTRVGRFIRHTSLDELPQLFNVLRGKMSLVGPRPHAIGSRAGDKPFWEVDERYWIRHALKPGITGLAQVRGLRGATRQEHDLTGRLNSDLEYLRGWSLWRDVRIMVATLGVVVHERAY
jgi:lipopolysaccharide/colanic/teichoic acid biosynthesis glycosyltransferase